MAEIVNTKENSRKSSEKDKEWRLKNRERLLLYHKAWNKENSDRLKEYRIQNKEKMIKTSLEWQRNNKEKAKEHRRKWLSKEEGKKKVGEINKKWRENNREVHLLRRRQQNKIILENNPIARFSLNLRCLIGGCFRRGKFNFRKQQRTEEILGCSIEFFINYILSKCPTEVEIDDFGRYGYHIDHITPISTATSEDEIINLCHYTNLQPLWWRDNLIKSSKILN